MGKKSAPPPAPDYTALALQQAAIEKEQAGEQTSANRPNQYTPYGSTEWMQNEDGSWVQSVRLNPEDQQLLDNQRVLMGGQQDVAYDLMGNVGDTLRTPISLDGLPEIQGFDTSKLTEFADPRTLGQGLPELGDAGFGGVQEVQDAMMGRLAPLRDQARQSEVQRLKNQGLSESSEAFRRAMTRLDQGDTDAQQQALLKSMDAYDQIFRRQLAGRQQGFGEQTTQQSMIGALRGQQLNEQGAIADFTGKQRQQMLAEGQMLRDQPLNDYLRLVGGISPSNPTMPSFMGGSPYTGPNLAGAANNQYSANLASTNAENARDAATTSGLFSLIGGMFAGPMGAAAGSAIGGGIAT